MDSELFMLICMVIIFLNFSLLPYLLSGRLQKLSLSNDPKEVKRICNDIVALISSMIIIPVMLFNLF